jgi:hypothetical protein
MGAGDSFELETFTQLGVLDGPNALDDGQVWQPKAQEKPLFICGSSPLTTRL